MAIKSLIINPGSTSTKIGVFEDEKMKHYYSKKRCVIPQKRLHSMRPLSTRRISERTLSWSS
mgnify:CR=1 FL=1